MHHGYYYPNGYGPGPSVLPAQPWTGYPGGPIYQPGQPVYGPGTPITPGNGPTPIDGSSPYTPGTGGTSPYTPGTGGNTTYGDPGNSSGGSAPKFDPTNPGTSGGTGVPNPGDDDYGRQPPGQGTQKPSSITPTSGASTSGDLSTPFQQDSSRLPRRFDNSNVADDDPFQAPVIQASGETSNEVRHASQQAEATPVSFKTYSNHPRFEWVQGVVEYDDATSSWVIMYNDNPRTSDPNGGELTLASDPALSKLRTGDVVRIYGSLDDSEQDSRGKPFYRATRIESRRPMGR
jgi:hypothetical protein